MRISVFALCACLLSGCAVTRMARLYDLDTASILKASYRGHSHGLLTITQPDQAACSGEYSAVGRSDVGWGAIYSGTTVTQAVVATQEGEARGQAVATCADGTVFECEFVAGSGSGHGSCRDNKMHRYRLMF